MTSTRTRRTEGYATTGAVHQTSGNLPVYRCNECNQEVVWATSNRTGTRYLVNVSHGYNNQRFYIGADVHTCQPPAPVMWTAADLATDEMSAYLDSMKADLVAGRELDENTESQRVQDIIAAR